MKTKLKIKKGDKVYILVGKDRGKSGTVLKVLPTVGKVVVEGIGMVKKTVKGSQKNPRGGIVEKPQPVAASNVQLICSGCNKSVKVGYKVLKNGQKERICKKCGHEIKE